VRKKPPHRVAFGQAVRELRHERGWTQEGLADHAEMHWTYIGSVERGERNPSWDSIVRLAQALDVRASQLVTRAERLMAK